MENIDETIKYICDWIQAELKSREMDKAIDISEMIKALAELLSVREKIL